MDQSTVLIISDDPEFSGAITGRWQSERSTPNFTLMKGDLCQGMDPETFAVAIIGAVRAGGLSPRSGPSNPPDSPSCWSPKTAAPRARCARPTPASWCCASTRDGWMRCC